MLWLLLGTAILALLLASLRSFERASVGSIRALGAWVVALGGILLTLGLFVSGRGAQALAGLVVVGPMLWRRWQGTGTGARGTGARGTGGSSSSARRTGSAMSRAEAYEILGLKPGAGDEDIQAAHRRLMRMAHPDTGGSDWLASRINQARDVLLG